MMGGLRCLRRLRSGLKPGQLAVARFSEDQLLFRHRVGDGGMVKFIYFGSGEMTQGDGWFQMH